MAVAFSELRLLSTAEMAVSEGAKTVIPRMASRGATRLVEVRRPARTGMASVATVERLPGMVRTLLMT